MLLMEPAGTRGVEGLEVGAGVGDCLERGVLGGRTQEETVFTCRDSSNI